MKRGFYKRILARMLVVILVIQMALPLNVMAAPSELQSGETEVEDTLLVDGSAEKVTEEVTSGGLFEVEEEADESESAEISDEAEVEEEASEYSEIQETTEAPSAEPEEVVSFEISEADYKADPYEGIAYEVWEGGFRVATIDGKVTLIGYEGPIESVIIPNGIEVIGQYVFASAVVGEICIPESIKKIEAYAFAYARADKFTLLATIDECDSCAFCAIDNSPRDSSMFFADEYVISDNATKGKFISVYGIPREHYNAGRRSKVTLMKDVVSLGAYTKFDSICNNYEVENGNNVYYAGSEGELYKFVKDEQGNIIGSSLELWPDEKEKIDKFILPDDVLTLNDTISNVDTFVINDKIEHFVVSDTRKVVIPRNRKTTFTYKDDYTFSDVVLEEMEVEEGNEFFYVKDNILYYYLTDENGEKTGELSMVAYPHDLWAENPVDREIEAGVVQIDNNIHFENITLTLHGYLPDTLLTFNGYQYKSIDVQNVIGIKYASDYSDNINADYYFEFKSLETVEVAEDNPYYKSQDNMILSKDGKTLYAIHMYGSVEKEFYIPQTVTGIKANAVSVYYDNPIATNTLYIPAGVTTVETGAFYYWKSEESDAPIIIKAIWPGATEVFVKYSIISTDGANYIFYCLDSEVDSFGKQENITVIGVPMTLDAPLKVESREDVELCGQYLANEIVKIWVNDVCLAEIITDENGEWSTFVDLPAIAEKYWNVRVTDESGYATAEEKRIYTSQAITILLPEITVYPGVTVTGYAEPDVEVNVYVDGEVVLQTKADGRGFYKGMIALENPSDGKEYAVSAVFFDKNHEIRSETKTVVYKEQYPLIEELLCYQSSEEVVDLTDADQGFAGNIIFTPDHVLTFKLTLEGDFTDQVESIMFHLPEEGNADNIYSVEAVEIEPGVWEAQFHSYNYISDALFIECTLKNGDKGIIYACKYKFIIDPSGYIYEVTPDNRIESAKVEIYYKENESDTEGILWDAKPYDQVNPLYTDAKGYYGWDVPKGYWQVVASADGYQTAKSDWMSVPPIRTDVNLELISTQPTDILDMYLNDNLLKVNFSHYMKCDSIVPAAFSVKDEALGRIVKITPCDEILYKGEWVAKEFLIAFEEFSIAGNRYDVTTDETIIETYAGITGLQSEYNRTFWVWSGLGMPEEVVYPKGIAVLVGETKEVEVKVTGKGDLSGYGFSLYNTAEAYDHLEIVTEWAETNEDGVAVLEIKGLATGSVWVEVCDQFGKNTKIPVSVVRSESLLNELEDYYEQDTDNPGGGNEEKPEETKIPLTEEDYTITLEATEYIYTGEEITPTVTITDEDGKELVKDTDYTVAYRYNKDVSKAAYVIIRGIGNYSGYIQKEFTIKPAVLDNTNINWGQNVFKVTEYTVEEIASDAGLLPRAVVTVGEKTLVAGVDYEFTAMNNKQPGKATAILKGIGNYTTNEAEYKFDYTIEGVDLAKVKFDKIPTQNCVNGKCEVVPVVNAAYLEKNGLAGISFKTYYEKNDKPGTASVYLYGGEGTNTTGKKMMTFKIAAYKISGATITINNNRALTYTGSALKPSVTVYIEGKKLTQDKDYVISYSNNVNVSKKDKKGVVQPSGKVTIKGKGAYTGSLTKNFEIKPLSIVANKKLATGFVLEEAKMLKYTGKTVKPSPKLYYSGKVLKVNKDYKVVVEKEAVGTKGTTSVVNYTIEGLGNFSGSLPASVVVTDEKYSVKLSVKGSKVYTGEAITLEYGKEIKVYNGKTLLGENDGYTLAYSDNVNAGTAMIKVLGKENIVLAKASFKISPQKLTAKNTVIEGVPKSTCYTGKEQKAAVTIKFNGNVLSKNDDITVTYSNNTKPGKAKITMKAKGNYSGTITKTFTIDKIKEFSTKYLEVKETNNEFIRVIYHTSGKYENGSYYGSTINLTEGVEYTVKYSMKSIKNPDGTESRQLVAKVSPVKSYYAKTQQKAIEINTGFYGSKNRIGGYATTDLIKLQVYKNKPVEPKITVKFFGLKLEEGKDYEVEYINNDKRGMATAVITGKGFFSNTSNNRIEVNYFIF